VSGVDFVVNCYERTYRGLLQPERLEGLIGQHRFRFTSRTVLINNVDDRKDAQRVAKGAIEAGLIDRAFFVGDNLASALAATGLKPRHLRRLPHFTDCCLVAVTIAGPEMLVYWDADAMLEEPRDWISPCLALMAERTDIAVANPESWHGLAEREALSIEGRFAIGYGFSDVAFLARRSELARPIYRYLAPASWRHPLAHVEAMFEQRVDSYMRRTGRLRATWLDAIYLHEGDAGINYPDIGLRERARRKAFRKLFALAQLSSHPALRAFP